MMRYGWLGDFQPLGQFAHRAPLAAADRHDLLTSIVGQCLSKFDGVELENRHCGLHYIEVCLCVNPPPARVLLQDRADRRMCPSSSFRRTTLNWLRLFRL